MMIAVVFASTASTAGCPNEAIREAQTSEVLPSGTTYLPNCMALEMVTPVKKFGQETVEVAAFSADGSRVLFRSKAALAGTPGSQSFAGDGYVASRSAGGWATAPTSAPAAAAIAVGGGTAGGPYAYGADLEGWTLFGGTQRQLNAGEAQIFRGGLGGAFAPLSPLLVAIDDSGTGNLQFIDGVFSATGTASDLRATVFPTFLDSTAYLLGDPRNTSGDNNSYVAFVNTEGNPSLALLARDQVGKIWGGRCGSRLGGGGLNQGAISPDGSRIFFSTRPAQPEPSAGEKAEGKFPSCNTADPLNPLRILVRSGAGPQINELIPGGPAEGSDLYQGTSLDGVRTFLATPRKLVASDLDPSSEACDSKVGKSVGCDLYLYDSSLPEGSRLIQVSAGETVAGQHEAGKGADVLGSAIAISPDGSHVYFVAQGALTGAANPAGAVPVPNASGTGTLSAALGQGDLTNGSATVTNVGTSSGVFAVGQMISATGIPIGTTITAVGAGTLTLSAAATATATSVALQAGSKVITGVTTTAGAFVAGQTLTASGVPLGTTITAVGPGTLELSGAVSASGVKSLYASRANLYLYERDAAPPGGRTAFVGTLAEGDKEALWAAGQSFANGAYAVPLLGGGVEGGGDGHILFLRSAASLTANDTDGGRIDVFRYGSVAGSESLQCVSCAPGGPDSAPFDASAGINEQAPSSNFAERGRWASEDGESVAFATAEPLVADDVDGKPTPYLWREGGLARLPGNMGGEASAQRLQNPLLSLDGQEVAFTTTEKLLPQDGDTARDAYLVRAGGGFPNPVPPVICEPLTEGACRGPATQPGFNPVVATESPGPGNQPEAAKCRKGQVRKHGKCVNKPHRKKKHGNKKNDKRASHKPGGSR
jgi:hypothetical protein